MMSLVVATLHGLYTTTGFPFRCCWCQEWEKLPCQIVENDKYQLLQNPKLISFISVGIIVLDIVITVQF